jgi:hypothetical protein
MELGWKQDICSVYVPVFPGIQGPNANSVVTEDSSPLDFCHLLFNCEIFAVTQN